MRGEEADVPMDDKCLMVGGPKENYMWPREKAPPPNVEAARGDDNRNLRAGIITRTRTQSPSRVRASAAAAAAILPQSL